MSYNRTVSTVSQRQVPAGKVYFDQFDSNGAVQGERYMGLTPGLTVSIATDKIQSYTMESNIQELDDETVIKITRTGKLTTRQLSMENLALFLAANVSVVDQATATVSGENKTVFADRTYQLGTSTSQPSGVRAVGSVTVVGKTASDRADSTAYAVGDRVKSATTPTHLFVCTVAGTSGSSAPTWPTVIDETVTDGTVTWRCETLITLVENTDYTVNTPLGRVYVLPGARVSQYGSEWTFGYSKLAAQWERLATGDAGSMNGALRFIADNAKGSNRDNFAPNVTLSPSGDMVIKAESPAYVELSFDLSFSKGANGEPALVLDGRPA